jgi:predicted AAA+ superfamily ATPase
MGTKIVRNSIPYKRMRRSYEDILQADLIENRQMIFLTGPRQVGKTTLCQRLEKDATYLNWDNQDDSLVILEGPSKIAETADLHTLRKGKKLIIFDEIHKYSKWKAFLKGFFDSHNDVANIVVTGSSKLDLYKKGGDSLMGRYFLYRLHPFSMRETTGKKLGPSLIQAPSLIDNTTFESLSIFGGFPEPFLKGNMRFYNRWKRLRLQQLFQEDVRDLTRIQEIQQLEVLSQMIIHQTGQLLSYSSLAKKVRVSVDTIRRWISSLNALYFSFTIQPWSKNIPRSLLKQPKLYLWDWSLVHDAGLRNENLVASHLKKAVDWWTDNGFGEFDLFFLRDKEKREVDFLVTHDHAPWFLVEVKSGKSNRINKHLEYFQHHIKADHAFQLSMALDYVDEDCFSIKKPVIVPAKTLLTQLV